MERCFLVTIHYTDQMNESFWVKALHKQDALDYIINTMNKKNELVSVKDTGSWVAFEEEMKRTWQGD